MKRKRVFIFLAMILLGVNCQYDSPCSGLLSYLSDYNTVFGLITLKPNGASVYRVYLQANFTVAGRLPTAYIGRIEAIGNGQLLQGFNRGVPLQYRVHFPVTRPLPRVTSITVNGDVLCYGPGDVPGPTRYVTAISLDHMLYLKGQNQGFSPSKPEYTAEFVGQLGDNIQVFEINEIGNKDGSWTSVVHPIDKPLMNNTRPVYEQTTPPASVPPLYEPVVRPPRPKPPPVEIEPIVPKPDFTKLPSLDSNIYYPDQTTQSIRPPPPTYETIPPITNAPPRQPTYSPIECGTIAGGNDKIALIYNGNSYPRGEWPWLVAIYKRQQGSLTFICSGTLTSERHIITAAHCMHQKSKISTIKDMVVKVGVYNLEDWGDDISVTRTLQSAHIHEEYNATTLENDILVLTMERTVEFNNFIRPACLWNGNTDLNRIVGASGVVAGWGQSEVGPIGKGDPRMVRVPVVSTATCRASKPEFHRLTSAKTLCAGDRNGSGPCLGDSGGGLYILENGRWRLRGVVSLSLRPSNGDNTCNLDEYIVFTDTAQYLQWIKEIMSRNLFDK